MTTATKHTRYKALVAERKLCRLCVGLRNPSEPELAAFDSDEVGPWSRLHGDFDADLMIIGQDWGGVRYYTDNHGLDNLQNSTMQTLERLLRGIGLDVSFAAYGTKPSGVRLFLTNAVLCLKEGSITAEVDDEWVKNCGVKFLQKQIEVIVPRVVVALGQLAYKAVLWGFDLRVKSVPYLTAVEDVEGVTLRNGSRLLAVYHCAPGVLNRTRSFEEQQRDWQRVAKALEEQ